MIKKLCLCFLLGYTLQADTIITEKELLTQAHKGIRTVTTEELVQLLKTNPDLQIIDVRTQSDIIRNGGYIKANKVTNVPKDKLEFDIHLAVEPDETFVVYCNDHKISLMAAQQLKKMGYKNVIYYEDSFKDWKKKKLPIGSLDKNIYSPLYSTVDKIAPGIYTAIGITAPYLYESNAHNNNLGFVIGDDSVLVWNAGSSYIVAKALHEEIKKITNKPVKYVLLENSQGSSILGANYWKEQGATIISHQLAKQEIEQQGNQIFNEMREVLKDKFIGTKVISPDKTFKETISFDLGNKIVEAKYFGFAHSKSDICLWLPKEKIVFSGDLAYNNRLLDITKTTQTKQWIETFDKFAALNPKIIIPGHGDITNLETVTKYTKNYLVYMRTQIKKIVDNDGGLNDAYAIDLKDYEHLDTFREYSRQNISTLFSQIEFED